MFRAVGTAVATHGLKDYGKAFWQAKKEFQNALPQIPVLLIQGEGSHQKRALSPPPEYKYGIYYHGTKRSLVDKQIQMGVVEPRGEFFYITPNPEVAGVYACSWTVSPADDAVVLKVACNEKLVEVNHIFKTLFVLPGIDKSTVYILDVLHINPAHIEAIEPQNKEKYNPSLSTRASEIHRLALKKLHKKNI